MASLFTKILTNIKKIMFTEDSLATAQIAKIFGSELMNVQESARTDGGSQPQIVKMHPKQFLGASPQFQAQQKVEELRIMQALQREAEAAHPLPQQTIPQQTIPQEPVVQAPAPQVQPQVVQAVQPAMPSTFTATTTTSNVDVWERINSNLERIANSLERVDISVKKRRVRRTSKTTA